MKKLIKKIPSLVYALMGVMLMLLPKLYVCPIKEGGDVMNCWRVAEIEFFLGILLILVPLVGTLSKGKLSQKLEHISASITGVIGIMIPAKIVGGCMSPLMMCHKIGFPLIYGICGLVIGVGIVCLVKDIYAEKKNVAVMQLG